MEPQEPRPFEINIQRRDRLAVARLVGSATIDRAEELGQELRHLANEPVDRIVLDLSDLDFVCSMALGAIIVAHVVCRKRDAQLVLASPQPAIRHMLETTRLSMVLPVFADLSAAMPANELY